MARRAWERMSVGFARQTGYAVENTTPAQFTWADVALESPPVHARKIQDFAPASPQLGGRAARLAGSKHGGTFSTRFPLRCCSTTYDGGAGAGGAHVLGTTDGIISPEFLLLATALGSGGAAAVALFDDWTKGTHLSVDVGAANAVTAGTVSTISVADATQYIEGQLIVAMTGNSDANPAIGWISDATAGFVITLAEDLQAAEVPVATDEIYDTAVAYLSDAARVPLTMRVSGNNDGFLDAYVGCIATEIRVTLGAGDLWWVEIDWLYTDRTAYSTGGGLTVPGTFTPAAALLGDDGGRMLFGAQGAATEVSALGHRDIELKIAWSTAEIADINAVQGVAELFSVIPEITLSEKVPVSHDDAITSGEDPYETILSTRARRAFQFTSGRAPGGICSLYLPAMQLREAVPYESVDGVLYYSLTWEPGTYSGDTGSVVPANNLVRFGIA